MLIRKLGIDVLTAARQRIAWTFDRFEKFYISFSGGKDSTIMVHLVMEEAMKRKRKVGLFFLDWECQFTLTIEHVREIFNLYAEHIIPYWVAVPIRTWNGCSQFEPEWVAWEQEKKPLWVREPDPMSITDPSAFPFYTHNMMFEEFVPAFGQWFSEGKMCANFIGIRTAESLNRFRTLATIQKPMVDKKRYTTLVEGNQWNVYPIYDWRAQDDWTYYGKFRKPYNKLYDRMYQAGLTLHQMRIDEPFGDTQRQGLWLYQIIEPILWGKMCLRVAGANTGALYGEERGNILGNKSISLPEGHTWKSFAEFLLNTMPPKTAEHYKNKISVYLRWHLVRAYPDGIPDCLQHDLGSHDIPSWRRICKVLLRNDYWCKGLCFSPTKTSAYEKYQALMKKRRDNWNIFPTQESAE